MVWKMILISMLLTILEYIIIIIKLKNKVFIKKNDDK